MFVATKYERFDVSDIDRIRPMIHTHILTANTKYNVA